MIEILKYLSELSLIELFSLFLIENLILFFIALGFGWLVLKIYNKKQKPNTKKDWFLALLTNLINTVITLIGFYLYKIGFIKIELSFSASILLDFLILFFAMDLLMYVFHYFIHHSFLYRYVHQLHHQAIHPKPIDLFILHPIETFGFGALWLILLCIYPFSWISIAIYLILNELFGIIGHLGFEPIKLNSIKNHLLFKYIGLSSFHHTHHESIKYNFGFYTNIWDRIFGTYR